MSNLELFELVVRAVFGGAIAACFASFAGVVAERGFAGASQGRSMCACGRELRASENVPVLGWLRTRGVAPCCGAQLPARYVTTEAGLGLIGALVAAVAPFTYVPALLVGTWAVVVLSRRFGAGFPSSTSPSEGDL